MLAPEERPIALRQASQIDIGNDDTTGIGGIDAGDEIQPAMRFSNVDLPEPLRPRTAIVSPRWKSALTSSSTMCRRRPSVNDLLRCLNSISRFAVISLRRARFRISRTGRSELIAYILGLKLK
jgi:hypothetical protein